MLIHRALPSRQGWFSHDGKEGDVVVATTMELSRNLADLPFNGKDRDGPNLEVRRRVEEAGTALSGDYYAIDGVRLRPELRRFFLARGVLAGEGDRAFSIVSPGEEEMIRLGGEDHLVLQGTSGGWNPGAAQEKASRLDRFLEERLSFAVSLRLGYLSPRLHRAGTGLTAGAVLFLPALHQGAQGLPRRAKEGGLQGSPRVMIRALSGEEDLHPSLYRLTCRASFGESEEETTAELAALVERLVYYERKARDLLLRDHRQELEDAVHRALGVLAFARVLSRREAMEQIGLVRLGAVCGLIEGVVLREVTNLFFAACDSSVVVFSEKKNENNRESLDVPRAGLIREMLKAAVGQDVPGAREDESAPRGGTE
ncbi:hypothetical protein [Alkalispirochaeta alkalica]|uniref:hypothetical protein n=1 Tax=Alkalispirochaeta alkalica TaxID=46356 RepID=UPI000A044F16|nr:hypothetical protein [Alkalispirochaeta alkalica]